MNFSAQDRKYVGLYKGQRRLHRIRSTILCLIFPCQKRQAFAGSDYIVGSWIVDNTTLSAD